MNFWQLLFSLNINYGPGYVCMALENYIFPFNLKVNTRTREIKYKNITCTLYCYFDIWTLDWSMISFFSLFEETWYWYFLLPLVLGSAWISLYTFPAPRLPAVAGEWCPDTSAPQNPMHTWGFGLHTMRAMVCRAVTGGGCHPLSSKATPELKLGRAGSSHWPQPRG